MEFEFKISKLGNLFFFVANLSEWHFSCRKEYNRIWRNSFATFGKKEQGALRQFREILKRYEKETPDGVAFPLLAKALHAKQLTDITKRIRRPDAAIVEDSLLLFNPAFEKLWHKAQPRLKKFVQMTKQRTVKSRIHRASKILEVYFGKPHCKKVDAYLLFAPPNQWGGGGANIDPGKITLEVGDISPQGVDWASRTLLHETVHACYEKDFLSLLNAFVQTVPSQNYQKFKIVKFFGDVKTPLKELIISSIIGEGIIDEKIFKFPPREQLKRDIVNLDWKNRSPSSLLRKSAGIELYSLNQKYLKKKKTVDIPYIKYAWEFLKRFEQKYSRGRIKELASL